MIRQGKSPPEATVPLAKAQGSGALKEVRGDEQEI